MTMSVCLGVKNLVFRVTYHVLAVMLLYANHIRCICNNCGSAVSKEKTKERIHIAMASNLKEGSKVDDSGQGRLRCDTHLDSNYEDEHGSDFLSNQDVFRPESTFVDNMKYIEVGQILEGLNMDSTDSVKEDKHRLKQRLFSGQRIQSSSQEIKDVLNKTVQKYKDLRKKLIECCSELIETVENKFCMSEVTEMRFPDHEEKLQSIRTMLQNMTDEFEIVVSGETSSGKSTFLNVLLGERILPSHHLHTTTSLCRLHCSENRRIEYIVENRIVDTITLKADSMDLREKLEPTTNALLSQPGEDEPLKAADIYWPVSSLHENVVLVDTPGIGERDALTKQVIEYVPKSAGYIFIVDSSHAGGVQDSGIRKLIEAIGASDFKEDHIKDLSNAIFVCNKWDLVPKQERDAVLEDTKKKICKYCGQLEDWQIVQFNADLELRLLKWMANPTDDFIMLLKSLETLMIRTTQTRLGDQKRYLRKFLSEVTGFVKARMTAAELTKEEKQVDIEKAKRELHLAKKGLEQCSEVAAMIKKEEKLLLQALEGYLKSTDVQRKHFDWTFCTIKLTNLKKDGPALIKERIQDAILEWATAETSPVKEASARITDKCKEMQAEINLKISNINHLKLGFSLLSSSDQSDILSCYTRHGTELRTVRNELDIALTCSLLLIVGNAIGRELGLITTLFWTVNSVAHAMTMKFKIMTEITEAALDKLSSENHLQNFITDSITGPHRRWLTQFENNNQCTIASTYGMIQQMEQEVDINMHTLQMYKSIQRKLNECSKCLQKL